MTSSDYFIYGVLALVVIAVVAYYYLSKKPSAPQTPDLMLGEAEIFLAYGRKHQAVEHLEKARILFPDSAEIRDKLRELNTP